MRHCEGPIAATSPVRPARPLRISNRSFAFSSNDPTIRVQICENADLSQY